MAPLQGAEWIVSLAEGLIVMTRLSLFNSPLLLGFEQFEQTVDRITRASADGYPPYNIEKWPDGGLRITLAVAGFSESDLSVHVEDRQLVVQGKQAAGDERVYLHRGIAARQFQRTFVLADGIKVVAAEIDSGLLRIELDCPPPETRIRKIEIRTPARAAARGPAAALDVDGGDAEAPA